ncbi:hypothetical protein D7030_00325 [Flavobacteriaceae bacterium AU392]|nr:hypothetical protein D1817_14110 [Flavobacteriaceae bacterium]RKM86978.1 hypothetical protein D7030_00325 [Flavobacteriaceae bacterium AU392]
MKIINLSLLFLITISFSSNAQDLKRIPPSAGTEYPNGWFKFIEQGAAFDVEVLGGNLVQGNVTWFDQTKYSGSFSGHDISGKGTYIWVDGRRYEGSFRENKRHGWGVMYYSDGTKHHGKWKNNKRHGKGKVYDKEGKLVKEGKWENDIFIGAKKKKK